jgi:hypothetical protein
MFSYAYSIYYNLFVAQTEIKSCKLFCVGIKYEKNLHANEYDVHMYAKFQDVCMYRYFYTNLILFCLFLIHIIYYYETILI